MRFVSGFDWDDGNWPKCGKHGLSKAEIEFVFRNQPAIHNHPGKSEFEERSRAIGRNSVGRHVYISFTLRHIGGQTLIRPVSARYMHQKEIEHYERQQQGKIEGLAGA